jgi:hypothetical protein
MGAGCPDSRRSAFQTLVIVNVRIFECGQAGPSTTCRFAQLLKVERLVKLHLQNTFVSKEILNSLDPRFCPKLSIRKC